MSGMAANEWTTTEHALRYLGRADTCYWKWLEMALLAGRRPG